MRRRRVLSSQGGRWLSRRHHHLGHRRPWHLAASESGRFGDQLWPEHWSLGNSLWDSRSGGDCSGPWHPRPRRQPRRRQRPTAELLSRCQVSRRLGAITPQGPSHGHEENGSQHKWQSQRPHLRHRTHSWTGEGGRRYIALRLHDHHCELLQHSHQTLHRCSGLRGRLRFHLSTSSRKFLFLNRPGSRRGR